MAFNFLNNDQVSIIKKNGDAYVNIKATVSVNTIAIPFSQEDKFSIEIGDIIERILPTGHIEKYDVLNPKFYHGFASIPQHYQVDVEKQCIPKKLSTITHININGSHNRINQNSIDHSQNIFNHNEDISRYISDIRDEINNLKSISDSEKKEYFEIIEQVNTHCFSTNKSKKIISTLLNALPSTATIISSVGSILSTLFP